jgi:hypothetical protein
VADAMQRHLVRGIVRAKVYEWHRIERGPFYMASWWFGFLLNCANMVNRRTMSDFTVWTALLLWANQTWTATKIAYVAQRAAQPPRRSPSDDARSRNDASPPDDDAFSQLVHYYVEEFGGSGPHRLRL